MEVGKLRDLCFLLYILLYFTIEKAFSHLQRNIVFHQNIFIYIAASKSYLFGVPHRSA